MIIRIQTSQDLFFLESASQLCQIAREEERDRRTACVVGTVTCSVSYLECVINGLYEHAGHAYRPTKLQRALASVWDDAFDRQRVLTKYQLALALANKPAFNTSAEPYQSVNDLLQLRNAIAHPKEVISSQKSQEKLERVLSGKFRFGEKEEYKDEFFPDRCLTPECALWAVESVSSFVKEFKRKMPPRAFVPPIYHDPSIVVVT